MQISNETGSITISTDVIATVAGAAASSCFGVKGMTTTSLKDGIVHLLRRESMRTGVKVRESGVNTVALELHVAIDHGVNIVEVCRSIISEVRYNVERMTAVSIDTIEIFVDSLK